MGQPEIVDALLNKLNAQKTDDAEKYKQLVELLIACSKRAEFLTYQKNCIQEKNLTDLFQFKKRLYQASNISVEAAFSWLGQEMCEQLLNITVEEQWGLILRKKQKEQLAAMADLATRKQRLGNRKTLWSASAKPILSVFYKHSFPGIFAETAHHLHDVAKSIIAFVPEEMAKLKYIQRFIISDDVSEQVMHYASCVPRLLGVMIGLWMLLESTPYAVLRLYLIFGISELLSRYHFFLDDTKAECITRYWVPADRHYLMLLSTFFLSTTEAIFPVVDNYFFPDSLASGTALTDQLNMHSLLQFSFGLPFYLLSIVLVKYLMAVLPKTQEENTQSVIVGIFTVLNIFSGTMSASLFKKYNQYLLENAIAHIAQKSGNTDCVLVWPEDGSVKVLVQCAPDQAICVLDPTTGSGISCQPT